MANNDTPHIPLGEYSDKLDVPHPLPVGMTEFNEWAQDIIQLAGKFADVDDMKWALSSQVLHLSHDKAYVPKRFFVNCLRKAAANQVVSQAMNDIKAARDAKIAAEKAQQTIGEDTAIQAASNVPTT